MCIRDSDSRGHGDSARAPDANYAIETLTADVMRVIDAIGRPVVLIGASMGGLTGILAANRAGPVKVTRLVLVDVVPRFEKNGSARIRDFMLSGLDGFETQMCIRDSREPAGGGCGPRRHPATAKTPPVAVSPHAPGPPGQTARPPSP